MTDTPYSSVDYSVAEEPTTEEEATDGTRRLTEAVSITCVLAHEPTCGLHVPYVTATPGLLPNMDTLEEHQVDCTIVDYNPTSELNVLAHDNLTISGTFLPYELEKSDVTLTFSNDDAT